MVVRRYLPPSSSTRDSILSLSSQNKYRWRVLPRPPSPAPLKKMAKSKSSTSSPSERSKLTISKDSSLGGSERTLDKHMAPSDEHVITAPVVPSSLEPTPKLGTKSSPRHQIVSGITVETSLGSGSIVSQEVEGQREDQEDGGERMSGKDEDTELFPMGYCGVTKRDNGWIDLACGPSISIVINYKSHNHDVKPGVSTPLTPNLLNIDIDAPVVLLRVFGCLGRDLLALKVNSNPAVFSCPTFDLILYFVLSVRRTTQESTSTSPSSTQTYPHSQYLSDHLPHPLLKPLPLIPQTSRMPRNRGPLMLCAVSNFAMSQRSFPWYEEWHVCSINSAHCVMCCLYCAAYASQVPKGLPPPICQH